MELAFVSLFPEVLRPYLDASILGRAQLEGHLEVRLANPRDFAYDRHGKVDAPPFGGEPGLLLLAEPVALAYASLGWPDEGNVVVSTDPAGDLFTQADAAELARAERVAFLCGRYEGVDDRVIQHLNARCLSIGDYVLTGGELPALVMADAIARQLPGVLGNAASLEADSHSGAGLSAPNYTRPRVWRGMEVPEALLSGDHAAAAGWRAAEGERLTQSRRDPVRESRRAALLDLIEYDRWANALWAPVLPALGEEGFATARHIAGASAIWLRRVGGSGGLSGDALFHAWRKVVETRPPETVVAYRNLKGLPFTRPLEEIVRHVSNHGTYHRGDLRRLAVQAGVEFPDTDYVYWRDVSPPR